LFFLFLLVCAWLVYVLKIGGDNPDAFPGWRHLVHLAGPIALLTGAALYRFVPQARPRWVALGAAILLTNLGVLHLCQPRIAADWRQVFAARTPSALRAPSHYYAWLRAHVRPTDTIASCLAGELPYIVDADSIDMLGLNDRVIARQGTFDPDGPVDSKTDMPAVLERRPDIIEGYISATRLRAGQPRSQLVDHRRAMLDATINHPIFENEYLFLLNGPYDSLDRALFLRRDYWARHPRKQELQCVPVLQTSLYLRQQ